MRNKLIIIAIVICSFLCIDRVSAKEYISLPSAKLFTENSEEYKFFSNVNNFPNDIHENIYIGHWDGGSSSEKDNYLYLLTYSDDYSQYAYNPRGNELAMSLFEKNTKRSLATSYPFESDFSKINYYYLIRDDNNNLAWEKQQFSSNQYIAFYFKRYNNLYHYLYNTDIYNNDMSTIWSKKNFEFDNKPKTPKITINIETTLLDDNNEVLQKKISVNWGLKSQLIFKYMWKNSNDDNWKYFFTNDITDEILVNKNGSYIFQVNTLNDDYVTSAAVNISGIKEQLPTLKLNDYTGIGCYYNNQQICAILTLYSDNADFSKYTLQYRFNDGNWITHNYENSAKGQIQIYENTTLTARLIRNSDNKLVDSATYTITKINTNVDLSIPTFKWDKLFCTNLTPNIPHEIGNGNYKKTLALTIYGLDMTKHRVFVSTNGANTFNEITQFEYEDRVPFVKYYYFEFYEDTSLIIKITDLNGNYITSATFNLHFDCNDISLELGDFADMNDVFKAVTNFFDKMKNIMMKIKEVIEYFYSSLNSEIKAFILTAFILIIVLNLIMRMMK